MSNAKKDATFSLKVMVNKEKKKVLFAEADNHFVDILLSFLTLPLGRIMKALHNKHYGENEVPTIGSLTTLYHSLANLDTAYFVTEGAKQSLLDPTSLFEDEYKRLKLDITDFQPAEYFFCGFNSQCDHDCNGTCKICTWPMGKQKEIAEKGSGAAAGDGVFTINTASFIIYDDLQIFPTVKGLFEIITILGLTITDVDKAEVIQVTIGLNEILSLLKALFVSPTPLSDVILNKTSVEFETKMLSHKIEIEENPDSKINLKVAVQISSGKVLYAEANQDFVEFLFSLLLIPLVGVKHLLAGEACFKAINNLYKSTTDLIDDEYFKGYNTKNRLMKPNVVHGCISKNHILPLTEESLPENYTDNFGSSSYSVKFPKGSGRYLMEKTTYEVMNDLTVTPFRICSIISSLKKQNIPLSDVKQVEVQIGRKEALSILKASLTSTSALSDALLSRIPIKQPKREA